MANVDPALGQEILDVAQRQRKHRNGLLIILNYQTWSRTKIKSDAVVSLVGFLASNRGMHGLRGASTADLAIKPNGFATSSMDFVPSSPRS